MRRALLAGLILAAAGGPGRAADDYVLGPDSQPQDGVPKGTVTKHTWADSQVFPNTVRDYWVYVPAQLTPNGPPACVMVFQDGGGYQNPKGQFRARWCSTT